MKMWAAGNQDVVNAEVQKMKYSAKWAIGIGLALTIFIVVWLFTFGKSVEDLATANSDGIEDALDNLIGGLFG